MTQEILSDNDLDLIFREARSFKGWRDVPVSEITIRAMYDLLRWGPTSFNCSPARFKILRSEDAKKKLADCASRGNKNQILTAPFTVIVGMDMKFYDTLPDLFKGYDKARDLYVGNADLTEETALRNSSLQGAYMIIAARALGLDCCPMSGFDGPAVNKAFFEGTDEQVNFICSMGYGNKDSLPARDRRLSFDEACEIL
ncbi:malonic semialdehyde reductase [Paremcibacter congregatus]|uniref:malonic semialdehyde reductase n=1 Tax=Paremcibacter congregatus TaxID=2043170 RepID=UPI003A934EEB|tara:strand:+ start:250 stop:846 length:597 start_codon:yes stop_codon:yes gene_type:complete